MKCESCGAALSLDMVYCPYCGKENKAVKQHVSDMAHYQGEFEKTKKSVYEKTHTYTHYTVKITIVAILAIVWVVMLILTANVYQINSAVKNAENNRNFEEIEAQIWEYLEAEEYYALAVYCMEREIETYDTKFEGYEPVIRLANQYKYIQEQLMTILTPPQYMMDDLDSNVGYLADYIEYFYENYNCDWEESDYRNQYDMSVMQPEMDKMEQKLQVLLRAYVGLSEEEAAQFGRMKRSQQILLLEEGLLGEEE